MVNLLGNLERHLHPKGDSGPVTGLGLTDRRRIPERARKCSSASPALEESWRTTENLKIERRCQNPRLDSRWKTSCDWLVGIRSLSRFLGVCFLHTQAPELAHLVVLKPPTWHSKQMPPDSYSAIHSVIFSIGPWDALRFIILASSEPLCSIHSRFSFKVGSAHLQGVLNECL